MMRETFERCYRVLICLILGAAYFYIIGATILIWKQV